MENPFGIPFSCSLLPPPKFVTAICISLLSRPSTFRPVYFQASLLSGLPTSGSSASRSYCTMLYTTYCTNSIPRHTTMPELLASPTFLVCSRVTQLRKLEARGAVRDVFGKHNASPKIAVNGQLNE